MIVMGLDCSTKSSGWAIFEENELIDYGVIKSIMSDWRERLFHQGLMLGEIIDKYKPEKIYMEDVPLYHAGVQNRGSKVLMMLGAVQGLIYGVAASRGINIEFLQPSAWRSPLGLFDGTKQGTHRDEMKKKSVEKANKLFGLELIYKSPSSKFNEDDVSDAILVAYSQVGPRTFGKKVDK